VSFPTRGQIYQEPLDRIRSTLGRVSLDTFYQVTFSFGKADTWFKSSSATSGSFLNAGLDFKQKMSLLCAEAELPGTGFSATSAIGHFQGIQEQFATIKDYPPLNLVFYVDADHVMIEIFETWMDYINPTITPRVKNRSLNAIKRLNYPEDYKEIIHITKFERNTFNSKSTPSQNRSRLLTYEFVNVWPTNMTSMKLNYGGSNVLKLSVQLAYDRFFTSYAPAGGDVRTQPIDSTPPATSDDVVKRFPPVNRSGSVFGNTAGPDTDFVERDSATGARMDGGSDGPLITSRQALGLDPV